MRSFETMTELAHCERLPVSASPAHSRPAAPARDAVVLVGAPVITVGGVGVVGVVDPPPLERAGPLEPEEVAGALATGSAAAAAAAAWAAAWAAILSA